jgi:hypothetical protein
MDEGNPLMPPSQCESSLDRAIRARLAAVQAPPGLRRKIAELIASCSDPEILAPWRLA